MPGRLRPSGNRSLRASTAKGSAAFDIWILIEPPVGFGDFQQFTNADPVSIEETTPLPPRLLSYLPRSSLASVFAGRLLEKKLKLDKQKSDHVRGNLDSIGSEAAHAQEQSKQNIAKTTLQQVHGSVAKDDTSASQSKGSSLEFSVAKGIVRFENESVGCVSADRKKMEDIVFAHVENAKGRAGKPFEGHGHITLEHRPHRDGKSSEGTYAHHFIQLHTNTETLPFGAITSQSPTYFPPPKRATKSRGTQSEEAAARVREFMDRVKRIREQHPALQLSSTPQNLDAKASKKEGFVVQDINLIKRPLDAHHGPHNQPIQKNFGQRVEQLLLDAGRKATSTLAAKRPGAATLEDIKADAHKMVDLAAEELGQETEKTGLGEDEAVKDEDWEMVSQA